MIITPFSGRLELWGGVECTINRVGETYFNQSARSGHRHRLEDLDRIAALGIRKLRFPILWEEVSPDRPGEYFWARIDLWLDRLRALQIRPIAGLLHHGSGPRYTSLIDPEFPRLLAEYAAAVARRYPWIEDWTPVNEPLTTARFSGLYGHWYPHGKDARTFARALLNQVRGVAGAMSAARLVNPGARLVQTEDLGEVLCSPGLEYQAEFENERRWITYDLLCGSLERGGMVERHLRESGIPSRELAWFREHPCPPDVLGFNHYVTSSRYLDGDLHAYPRERWGSNGRDSYVDRTAVRGAPEGAPEPADLLHVAWERFRIPIAITEAHLGCTREEQIRWFGELWRAAEKLRAEQIPVLAVTAWSLFGAYDWDSLLTKEAGSYEPGAFDLRGPRPRATALAHFLRELACGQEPQSPFGRQPGWWRREVRRLDCLLDQDGLFDSRVEESGPPLLIVRGGGPLGQALARICHLRGLPYRRLERGALNCADVVSVRQVLHDLKPWAVIDAYDELDPDSAEGHWLHSYIHGAEIPSYLASCCAEQKVALLAFSSDLVFGGDQKRPYLEGDKVSPLSVYGRCKVELEHRLQDLHPGSLIVRSGELFDPWDDRATFTRMLRDLQRGEEVMAADDLWLSPTYLPEMIHAALDLLIDRETGLWHLAGAGEATWYEWMHSAAISLGLETERLFGCPYRELALRAPRPHYSALASQRGQLLRSWQWGLQSFTHEWKAKSDGECLASQSSPGLIVS